MIRPTVWKPTPRGREALDKYGRAIQRRTHGSCRVLPVSMAILGGIGNSNTLVLAVGPAGKALDMLDSTLGGGSGQLRVNDPSEIRLSSGLSRGQPG